MSVNWNTPIPVAPSYVIPTGDYLAPITDIEEAEGKYGPQLKFVIPLGDVENIDGQIVTDKQLHYFTSQDISVSNKTGRLAVALGLELDAALTLADFVGRMAVWSVVAKEEDGAMVNRVAGVRKPTAAQAAAANGRPVAAPAVTGKRGQQASAEDVNAMLDNAAMADGELPF